MNTIKIPVVLLQRADLERLVKDKGLLDALLDAGISAPDFEWGSMMGVPTIMLVSPQQRGS